jgi:hypothetical protein
MCSLLKPKLNWADVVYVRSPHLHTLSTGLGPGWYRKRRTETLFLLRLLVPVAILPQQLGPIHTVLASRLRASHPARQEGGIGGFGHKSPDLGRPRCPAPKERKGAQQVRRVTRSHIVNIQ